jgi:hypothetical protein
MKFKSLILTLMIFCIAEQAWAQDKPEPRYKPYPIKKSEAAESGSASDKESSPQKQPFGVTPSKALQARPPTSGKEPMVSLGPKNLPMTEPVHETLKLNYYECRGVIAPWFLELLVAEMNYFNELVELPFVNFPNLGCVVSVGTEKSLTPGRISVQLFANVRLMNDCVRDERCTVFRSVSLVQKGNTLYRSYFLSDLSRKIIAQHCVTDKGKLYNDTTCYTVD